MTQNYQTEAQGVLNACYDKTNNVLNLVRVNATASTTISRGMPMNAIFAACFDPTTASLRFVDVTN